MCISTGPVHELEIDFGLFIDKKDEIDNANMQWGLGSRIKYVNVFSIIII